MEVIEVKKGKLILSLITALFVCSCNVVNNKNSNNDNNSDNHLNNDTVKDSDKYSIYTLAQSAGYQGTYEEWLASIKGASLLTGNTNPDVMVGQNGDSYLNLSSWYFFVKENNVWINKGSIMGHSGNNGVSIVSVELTSSENLYDTYTITYSDNNKSTFIIKNGRDGINGVPGEDGKTPVITIDSNSHHWIIDGVDSGISAQGLKGEDGHSPNISIDPLTSHWIIDGVDSGISATGKQGESGHSPIVTIDPDSNHWIIDGVDTMVVAQGQKGGDGTNGKSAFDIYKQYYSYTGTEEQWLNDLINGRLSTSVTHTISFVTNVGVNIDPITVNHGAHIDINDIILPSTYAFKTESGDAYYIQKGTSFSGDFSKYEPWSLIGYGVYDDITLALDIYEKGTLRSLSRMDDETIINYYGRNTIAASETILYSTNSGFEVKFFGEELTTRFTRLATGNAVGSSLAPQNIKIRVYVDGDMSLEHSKVITLDATTDGRDIELINNLDRGTHTVLVRKINYDERGYLSLTNIGGAEGFYDAPSKPNKKVLFFGDSITVGYGVNYSAVGDVGGDSYSAEDGSKTYAAFLTDYYGLENQTYAISGVSIGVPSWRPQTVEQRWNYCSYFSDDAYDLTSYNPDLIILNLGTNDAAGLANGTTYGNGSDYAPTGGYTFWHVYASYYNLIGGLKNYYPNAKIIICYGMLGKDLSIDAVLQKDLITRFADEGINDVYYLSMDSVEVSANAAHPTVNGQYDGFQQIKAFIEQKNLL